VAKVDECFGKRGKRGYVKVCDSFDDAKRWVVSLKGKNVEIDGRHGVLDHFLVEPFIEHKTEYYLAFTCEREKDVILFSDKGGIDIEDMEKTIQRIEVELNESKPDLNMIPQKLHKTVLGLFNIFRRCDLSFLEINPLAHEDGKAYLLDAVCRVDTVAAFRQKKSWGSWDIPDGFGTKLTQEELAIRTLDTKTGSSLKFVLLNPNGRIWTMVAGGGASIIYADAITKMAKPEELANYGEWSGNPSTTEMEEYTKNILKLMVASPSPLPPHHGEVPLIRKGEEKVLIIGGGIANFTDIKKTFTGIIAAIRAYKDKLAHVKIFVRRAGPNDKAGLDDLQNACDQMGIACETHGAEMPMTEIVSIAIASIQ
jgi:ATP-citrate lyase beta-subunit